MVDKDEIVEYAVFEDNHMSAGPFNTMLEAEMGRNDCISADRAQGWPHTDDLYEVRRVNENDGY